MLDVAAQRPHFTTLDAQRIVREHFGRHPITARQLPSDRDQNFYLEEPSGEAFILKIASAAETEEVLDFQNQALLLLTTKPVLNLPKGHSPLATRHSSLTPFPQPLATRHSPLATRYSPLLSMKTTVPSSYAC